MTTHADIFFIISSIGFIALFIFLVVIGVLIVKLILKIQKLITLVETKLESIGEEAEGLLAKLEESFVFRLLFGARRSVKKKTNASRKKE